MAGPLSETRRSFQTECACCKMAKLSGRADSHHTLFLCLTSLRL